MANKKISILLSDKRLTKVYKNIHFNSMKITSRRKLTTTFIKNSSRRKNDNSNQQTQISIPMKLEIKERMNTKSYEYRVVLSDPLDDKYRIDQPQRFCNVVVYSENYKQYRDKLKELGVFDGMTTYDKMDSKEMYNISGTLFYKLCCEFYNTHNGLKAIQNNDLHSFEDGYISKIYFDFCMQQYKDDVLQDEYIKYREFIWLRRNHEFRIELSLCDADLDTDDEDDTKTEKETFINIEFENNKTYPCMINFDTKKNPFETSVQVQAKKTRTQKRFKLAPNHLRDEGE